LALLLDIPHSRGHLEDFSENQRSKGNPQHMLRLMTDVWNDFRQGENTGTHLTVLMLFAVLLLDVIGVAQQQWITAAILTGLALLFERLLSSQKQNEQTEKLLANIQISNDETHQSIRQLKPALLDALGKPSLGHVLIPWRDCLPKLRDRLRDDKYKAKAKKVCILTRTGIHFWSEFRLDLACILENRGTVHLLLLDPNGNALEQFKFQFKRKIGQVNQAEQIVPNMEALQRDLVVQKERTAGTFELRTIDYMPPWALVLVDPDDGDGLIQVGLGTFGTDGRNRPSFLISKQNNADLFEMFCQEFDAFWESALVVDGRSKETV
ncbi:MAG: hypothetical protein WBO24_03505, partial [Nitrospirales bacterium]